MTNHLVDQALELVGLDSVAKRKAGKYSLGMRQRLGLAGALLGRDPLCRSSTSRRTELSSPEGVRWLRGFLQGFAAEGNAVLVSSHLLAEMAQLADEAAVINRGRLVRQGAIAELTEGRSLEDAFLALTEEEDER